MVLEVGQGSCRQMELNEQKDRGVKAKGGIGGQQSIQACWKRGWMGWAASSIPLELNFTLLHSGRLARLDNGMYQWKINRYGKTEVRV